MNETVSTSSLCFVVVILLLFAAALVYGIASGKLENLFNHWMNKAESNMAKRGVPVTLDQLEAFLLKGGYVKVEGTNTAYIRVEATTINNPNVAVARAGDLQWTMADVQADERFTLEIERPGSYFEEVTIRLFGQPHPIEDWRVKAKNEPPE